MEELPDEADYADSRCVVCDSTGDEEVLLPGCAWSASMPWDLTIFHLLRAGAMSPLAAAITFRAPKPACGGRGSGLGPTSGRVLGAALLAVFGTRLSWISITMTRKTRRSLRAFIGLVSFESGSAKSTNGGNNGLTSLLVSALGTCS
jgi:hypothetical protein